MGSGWGWSAALAAASACLLCAGPAGAGTDDDATVILFSGRDLWRNGAFASGGFLTAPGGFDDDGLMPKVLFSGGLYRYRADDLGGDTVVGAECVIERATARSATIGDRCVVGPYASLGPGAEVPADSVTGSFYTAGSGR